MTTLPPIHRWPAENPRALVHVLHGMSEHGLRYERIARDLNAQGIAVWAHDHRGHGDNMGGLKGHFGDRDGWKALVDDAWAVSAHMMAAFPGLPLVLLAHSMGSFIGQTLMAEKGAAYRGVILSGTNGPPDLKEAAARALSHFQLSLGRREPGKWLDELIIQHTFNTKFAPNRTKFDWLSRSEAEVDKFVTDKRCAFPLTCQAWSDFLHGKEGLGEPALLGKIPKALPVWVIAGAHDPVGDDTKGVQRLLDAYREVGLTRVEDRFYPQARHELLHETNYSEVLQDLTEWLGRILS